MQKCRILLSLYVFGYSIYLLNNWKFSWFPRFGYFNFAGLLKMGFSWGGYLLELQKDSQNRVKIKGK